MSANPTPERIRCPHCGLTYDPRYLDEVVYHARMFGRAGFRYAWKVARIVLLPGHEQVVEIQAHSGC